MFHSVCTLNFIATLLEGIPKAKELIKRSFLEDTLKEQYRNLLDIEVGH